ncbi:MAG: hypothetical protein ACRD36_11155, partial [Candidatus Acidiferrum sp.]
MATDLSPAKSSPVGRHEAFVVAQLGKTTQRIRALDTTTALCGFVAFTCLYAALMVAADQWLAQSAVIRQLLFLIYLSGATAYLTIFVGIPLRRRINPYFAARQVERTLPEAKNSVVNWVDLHEHDLPASIRAALGHRAARDIASADLESAVSGRRAGYAGGLAAATLGILFVLLLIVGASSFFTALTRAFLPFRTGQAANLTQLHLVRPDGGNTAVPVGQSLSIAVNVDGKVPRAKGPDAVRLLYRYQEGDAWLERPLQEEEQRQFAATISAADIQSGFWYKVAGGDAETPEYRVTVRSTPQLTDFQVTYHFPKYASVPKETRRERTLRAVRGSEAWMWALTNRNVKDARVDFDGKAVRQSLP